MTYEIDNDLSLEGLDLTDLGLSEEFAPEKSLKGPDEIAAYLTEILEDDDFAQFNRAMDTIVRSEGASKIAGLAGITREGLYKALRADSKPRFETIKRTLGALGMEVKVVSLASSAKKWYALFNSAVNYACVMELPAERRTFVGKEVIKVIYGGANHPPGVNVVICNETAGHGVPPIMKSSRFAGVAPGQPGDVERQRSLPSPYSRLAMTEPEVIQPYHYTPHSAMH